MVDIKGGGIMPKIVSEEEKALVKEALYQKGLLLIREKGLKFVTVDDVVKSVGIGKGSFYSYYPSKEELLYSIVKKAEKKGFDTLLTIQYNEGSFRDKIIMVLNEIYLAPDSIALYVQPSDLEYLMRKLPDKIEEWENEKPKTNFKHVAELFGIDETDSNFGVLAYLMDELHYLATRKATYGESNRRQTLDIIVNAIAEFLVEKRNEHDSVQ